MYSFLSDFVNLITSRPNHHIITAFLSEHISPDKSSCAISYSVVNDDGYFEVVASAGYGNVDFSTIPKIHVSADRPASIALRSMKLTIFSKRELEKFDWWQNGKFVSQWNSLAVLPISTNKIYLVGFRTDITQIEDYLAYLRLVQDLLEINEGGQNLVKTKPSREIYDNNLSKRQELIVDLIKEGKTNMQIALDLGYSESLIRQETITIYRKLGIDGRKSLLDQ